MQQQGGSAYSIQPVPAEGDGFFCKKLKDEAKTLVEQLRGGEHDIAAVLRLASIMAFDSGDLAVRGVEPGGVLFGRGIGALAEVVEADKVNLLLTNLAESRRFADSGVRGLLAMTLPDEDLRGYERALCTILNLALAYPEAAQVLDTGAFVDAVVTGMASVSSEEKWRGTASGEFFTLLLAKVCRHAAALDDAVLADRLYASLAARNGLEACVVHMVTHHTRCPRLPRDVCEILTLYASSDACVPSALADVLLGSGAGGAPASPAAPAGASLALELLGAECKAALLRAESADERHQVRTLRDHIARANRKISNK